MLYFSWIARICYGLLCGCRADEGKFSDICVPTLPDDSYHMDVFSQQRAYCMYLLCAYNSPISCDEWCTAFCLFLAFLEILHGKVTHTINWVIAAFLQVGYHSCHTFQRLPSVNHALISPILPHPVLWVALPPLVPSTHHSHHPSLFHSRLKTFLFCKSFPP